MKNSTMFALVAAVALVAAALVGVGFAQLTTPNPTAVPNGQTVAPWCISENPEGAAPYCYNVTGTQTPYCYNATGTAPAYCANGAAAGYCASPQAQTGYTYGTPQGCHGYSAQGASQNWFGGMMGRGW
jgi:hypothetical protein